MELSCSIVDSIFIGESLNDDDKDLIQPSFLVAYVLEKKPINCRFALKVIFKMFENNE